MLCSVCSSLPPPTTDSFLPLGFIVLGFFFFCLFKCVIDTMAILESLSIEIIIIFFTQSNKFWVLFVFSDLRKESSEDYFLPL